MIRKAMLMALVVMSSLAAAAPAMAITDGGRDDTPERSESPSSGNARPPS